MIGRHCGASLFLSLSLVAICTAVLSPTGTTTAPGNPEGGHVEMHSDLFVVDGGDVTFTTTIPRIGQKTATRSAAPTGGSQNPFASIGRNLVKTEGDADAGYGLVFCHYDTHDSAFAETMLVVMLNTKGKYIAGKVVGSTFTAFFPWTYSNKLAAGLGVANRLKVVLSGGEFVIYLNNDEVKRFTDSEAPLHTQGADGYIVVISPSDSFPQHPVTVHFEP